MICQLETFDTIPLALDHTCLALARNMTELRLAKVRSFIEWLCALYETRHTRAGRPFYQIKRGKLRSLERRWIASRAVPATVPRISLRVRNIYAIHMYVEPRTKDTTAGRGSPEEPVERT